MVYTPLPLLNFNDINLESVIVEQQSWYRLNSVNYQNPIHFSKSGNGRFDGADQSYGILYLGQCEYVTFIEVFGRTHGNFFVTEKALKSMNLWYIESAFPLRFICLYGKGLVQMGADAIITSTQDYNVSRQWAEAIYHHPAQVNGLIYRSRLDNDKFCYGVFNRNISENIFTCKNLGSLLDDQELLSSILDYYNFGII